MLDVPSGLPCNELAYSLMQRHHFSHPASNFQNSSQILPKPHTEIYSLIVGLVNTKLFSGAFVNVKPTLNLNDFINLLSLSLFFLLGTLPLYVLYN